MDSRTLREMENAENWTQQQQTIEVFYWINVTCMNAEHIQNHMDTEAYWKQNYTFKINWWNSRRNDPTSYGTQIIYKI